MSNHAKIPATRALKSLLIPYFAATALAAISLAGRRP